MPVKKLAAASAAICCLTVVPAIGAESASFNPELSLTLQGLYKKAKAESSDQITGFFPTVPPHTEPDKNRGFLLGESELTLAANVDQHFRGLLNLSFSEGSAEVEEAWFQTLSLGHGLTIKGGRFLSGIGYGNEQHAHVWDFADASLMQRALFGAGSFAQDGLQVKWLAPTETFLEFGAEAGRGDQFPGSEHNQSGNQASALFAHAGGDLGEQHSWRAGLSLLNTRAVARSADAIDAGGNAVETPFTGKTRIVIVDAVWKWAIAPGRSFKLQVEAFRRTEDGALSCVDAGSGSSLCASEIAGAYASTQRGGYLQAVYQFSKEWRTGLRFDRLDSGSTTFGNVLSGVLAATDFTPKRSSLMVDWSPSEFSRLRLQLARDQAQQGLSDNQVTLQYVMSLGAHGAHKY